MDESIILSLVKERLGIATTVRDSYLSSIIKGVITELEDEKGLVLESDNYHHIIFIVDLAAWRYKSADYNDIVYTGSPLSMPRHLQFRLHNLMIHNGGGA